VAGQVVVMDNATFHKGSRIQELIQNAGCRLLYLPSYSRLPQLALKNAGFGSKVEFVNFWIDVIACETRLLNILRLVSGAAGRCCYSLVCRLFILKKYPLINTRGYFLSTKLGVLAS
jgi:hypothetical protein